MKRTINVLVYHIDADGFMSRFLMEEYSDVSFSDNVYSYNYENIITGWEQLTNKFEGNSSLKLHYFFVDVTPPLLWVNKMICNYPEQFQITVIDHHPITNEFIKLSKKYPNNVKCKCSLNLAGCQLCLYYVKEHYNWKYCKQRHKNILELIVKYIGDYDTWKFADKLYPEELRNSVLRLHEYLEDYCKGSYELFRQCIKLLLSDNLKFNYLLNVVGAELVNQKKLEAKNLLEAPETIIHKEGNDVKILFEGYPNAYIDFLLGDIFISKNIMYIGYSREYFPEAYKFSVRTRFVNKHTKLETAQDLAESYGGGGHRNAAGFRLNKTNGEKFIEKFQNFSSKT